MRLKAIKLSGFKSFSEPTTIEFNSNMCAIVGPNGCGKSNVIDAVRWVLGESSAKMLRGDAMTDVIFKGSNHRKPAAQASVELLFENDRGFVRGEYAAYSEISIKRKLTSDSKNDYFLNKNKCRRKDITDLISGTGLGPRSYSIISQGIVSTLIESKPEELRVFIEEAAGIAKYKERRRETENRIRRTNENLLRLNDIRKELGRQIEHLAKQAEKAQQYKNLKAQFKETKSILLGWNWQNLANQLTKTSEKNNQIMLEIDEQNTKLTSINTELEQKHQEQITQQEIYETYQTQFYHLGTTITRLEESIRYHENRGEELNNEYQAIEAMLHDITLQLNKDQQQLDQLEKELTICSPQYEQLKNNYREKENQYHEAHSLVQTYQETWQRLAYESMECDKEVQLTQSTIQHTEQTIEHLSKRQDTLKKQLDNLNAHETQQPIQILYQQREQQEFIIESLEIKCEELKELRQQLDHKNQLLTQAIHEQENKLHKITGQLDSVLDFIANKKNVDGDIKNWLHSNNLDQAKRLSDEITVTIGWEIAVERLLGKLLHAVFSRSSHQHTKQLLTNHLGGIIFFDETQTIPINIPYIDSTQKTVFHDLELLQTKITANKIMINHLFCDVYCCESLDQALNHQKNLSPHEMIILKNGTIVTYSWIDIPGHQDKKDTLLAIQNTKSNLQTTLSEVEEKLIDLKKQSELSKHTQQQQQLTQQNLLDQLNEEQIKDREIKIKLKIEENRISEQQKQLQLIYTEQAELEQQIQNHHDQLYDSRNHLQQLIEKMHQKRQESDKFRFTKEQQYTDTEQLRKAMDGLKEQLHQLQIKEQTLLTQKQAIQENIARLKKNQEQSLQKKINLEKNQEASHPETIQKQKDQLNAVLTEQSDIKERMQIARTLLDQLDTSIIKSNEQRQHYETQIHNKQLAIDQLTIERETLKVKQQAIEEQLGHEHLNPLDVILPSIKNDFNTINKTALEKTLLSIDQQIQSLGAINLASIEEYQTQNQRKLYLDQQDQDLNKAIEILEYAIRKIDKETRQRFKLTFEQVNDGFKLLFPKVFGGGKAYLSLTTEDLLETGITIMAQPPGKKNSTIHLLSGGEKALTAIALVFAIFHLNPSPFCLLDEVDAPLDDTNVDRYAHLVKEMSQKVQFIYISHNKIAMEAAEQLIGVTMPEAGISKPISVNITEIATMAE